MSEENGIRTNAKQTSKGEWYFDVTAETNNVEHSAYCVVEAIKQLQKKFKVEGFSIVEKKE